MLSRNVSRDSVIKAHRYAKVGLPQYWPVHPAGTIEIMILAPGSDELFRVEYTLTDDVDGEAG